VLRSDAYLIEWMGESLEHAIIDNADNGYSETGTWNTSVAQAFGTSSRFTPFGSGAKANFAYTTQTDGLHQLSFIVPETVNASEQARYQIKINGFLQDERIINQNEDSGEWVSLGNWFTPKNVQLQVEISDASTINTNKVLRADAIRWSFGSLQSTSAENSESVIPKMIRLHQNYPNPFNPSTIVSFDLPKSAQVNVTVWNIQGQRVATLIHAVRQAGFHEQVLNASGWASGVYFVVLNVENQQFIQKMMLIK
jgi:hypothetical protein